MFKKFLIHCIEPYIDSKGKLITKPGEYYTGYLSDDHLTLQVEGIDGQTAIIEHFDETGNRKAYYFAPDYNKFDVLRQLEPIHRIATYELLPKPDSPRFCYNTRNRTIEEVYKDIVQGLKELAVWDMLDYFNISNKRNSKDPFPEYNWISVFPVRGDSEGFYFHVEAINGPSRQLVYLGKTLYEDIEEALKINNALVKLFHR